MNNSKISLQKIQKTFVQGNAHISVLNDVHAEFEQGTTHAITGISGSGKSTLLHIMAGLEQPDSGTIQIGSTVLTSLSGQQLHSTSAKLCGVVFQQPYLIQELSVVENVMLKGLLIGKSWDECSQEAYDMLVTVGIADKAHVQPATLSGGQQQRVAILRALFNKPAFLLADEPTASLDSTTGNGVIDFLLDCHQEWNMGLIICSHDEYVVSRMHHVFNLSHGSLTMMR